MHRHLIMKPNYSIQKPDAGAAMVVAIALGTICYADNPIIQTKFTADPAPMVCGDTACL